MKNMFPVLHVLSLTHRDKTNLDFCLKHQRDVLSGSEAELGHAEIETGSSCLLPGSGRGEGYRSERV